MKLRNRKRGEGFQKRGGFRIQRYPSLSESQRGSSRSVWNSDKSLTRNTKLSKNPLVPLARLPYSLNLVLYGFYRSRHQRTIFKAATPRNNLVSSEGCCEADVASTGRLK